MTPEERSMLITGTSRGVGLGLAEAYLERGWKVFGCARTGATLTHPRYVHYELDVADEKGTWKVRRASWTVVTPESAPR